MFKKLILSFIFCSFFNVALAARDILPLSGVFEGQVGTAYTEIDQSGNLYPFTVKVNGILGDSNSPYIMAYATGSLIESANGVLQGMSGSPVYFDGKLAGAVSAGFKGMDQRTCLITPIEEMRKLWKMADRKNKRKIEPFDLQKALDARKEEEKTELRKKIERGIKKGKDELERIHKEKEEAKKKAEKEAQKKVEAEKAKDKAKDKEKNSDKKEDATNKEKLEKVGLYLTGFNEEGKRYLTQTLFKGKNVTFLDNSAISGNLYGKKKDIKPGSAIGAALTYGDFAIGATGTVTDVDGRKILAFGHPFTHRGNVNYFLTNATVIGNVASNSDAGAKMANLGEIIGRINQDREVGVAGILNEYPETVKMTTQVVDFALGKNNMYKSYIAYDEDLLTSIAAILMYAGMSKTTDTVGEATARVSFSLKTDMADGGIFKRENMIYSQEDFGKVAVLEIMQALNILTTNPEKDSEVQNIDVKVEVAEGRRTARIVSAIPDKSAAKAGDKVNFKVVLRPYRGKDEIVTVPYFIPYTQAKGDLNLDVRGGGLAPLTLDTSMFAQEGLGEDTKTKLKKFAETSKNNDIVIAPGPSAEVLSESEQKAMIARVLEAQKKAEEKFGKSKLKNPPKNKPYTTTYVIENFVKTRIKIEG